MLRPLAPIIATAAVLLAAAATAFALPGDPPSEPLAPADGATVPVDPDGIPVRFTCPVYRTYDDGQGFVLFGGASDHGVSFSRSPALGPDGRLADPVSTSPGSRDPAAEGRCVSALGAGGSPPRPQETPGTYYWQVWRLCTGCSGSYETGPVRRIVLRSTARLAIRRPPAPYAGFPRLVALRLEGLPDGTAVTVERRAGSRSVRLRVARRGRELRDFKAFVAMTCPSVQPGQFTTQIGTAAIPRAKVAPDGRFVAARSTGGSTMRIRGRVAGGRIAEGRAELSVGNCVGNTAYAARRAG